jgi:hypothetical protein
MSELSPKQKYKPIFNRTYLKYLGFVVAIAIILLSEKPAKPLDQIEQLENSAINLGVLQIDEDYPERLLLSFNSTPALSVEAKTNRKLMYQALNKSAQNIDTIHSVLWTQDRLEIEFRWPQEQPLKIKSALAELERSSHVFNTQQARKLIAAELYLHNQAPDNAALQYLDNRFSRALPNSENLRQVLSASPKAILFSHKDLTDIQVTAIDQQLTQLFHSPARKLTSSTPWQPFEQKLKHRSHKHQLLIATQLAQISNESSALELLSTIVLGDLLKPSASELNVNYRLLRQPILEHGYQAILLDSEHTLTANILFKIKESIAKQAVDEALISAKNRLVEHYNDLSESPDRLFKLYSKKYFYGLSTQSASEYEAQLDTITTENIRSKINQLLGENAIFIRLQPS